jgi:hypothetical protein
MSAGLNDAQNGGMDAAVKEMRRSGMDARKPAPALTSRTPIKSWAA